LIFNFDSYLWAANYPSEEIFHFCYSTTNDTIGETSEDTLFNEIKRISKIGEWSGMLMMVALTNSLNISIQQIYPKVESTKSPLYDYSNSRLEPFEKGTLRRTPPDRPPFIEESKIRTLIVTNKYIAALRIIVAGVHSGF
jgi:hypothetical protein